MEENRMESQPKDGVSMNEELEMQIVAIIRRERRAFFQKLLAIFAALCCAIPILHAFLS